MEDLNKIKAELDAMLVHSNNALKLMKSNDFPTLKIKILCNRIKALKQIYINGEHKQYQKQ